MLLPESDRHTHDRDYVEAMIAVKMGGRLAEEIFLGQVTTGASDDIQKATDLARRMVCEWGMSEVLGPVSFDRTGHEVFLGRDLAARKELQREHRQGDRYGKFTASWTTPTTARRNFSRKTETGWRRWPRRSLSAKC